RPSGSAGGTSLAPRSPAASWGGRSGSRGPTRGAWPAAAPVGSPALGGGRGVGPRVEEQHHHRAGHARPTLVDVGGHGGGDLGPLEHEAGLAAAQADERPAAAVGVAGAGDLPGALEAGGKQGDLAGGGGA